MQTVDFAESIPAASMFRSFALYIYELFFFLVGCCYRLRNFSADLEVMNHHNQPFLFIRNHTLIRFIARVNTQIHNFFFAFKSFLFLLFYVHFAFVSQLHVLKYYD